MKHLISKVDEAYRIKSVNSEVALKKEKSKNGAIRLKIPV